MSSETTNNPTEIQSRLQAPFDSQFIKLKPGVVKGNRAMAMVHVDARGVAERLDSVVGFDNWQDEYNLLSNGFVECRLSIRVGEEWVTKMDVGSPREGGKPDIQVKGAYSDAFKRAAAKFGIGRYLYSLKNVWLDFDPQFKQFQREAVENYKRTICPDLKGARSAGKTPPRQAAPAACPPKAQEAAPPAPNRPTVDPPAAERGDAYEPPTQPQAQPEAPPAKAVTAKKDPPPRPTNGRELESRLYTTDRKLHGENRIKPDQLMTAVLLAVRRKFPPPEGEAPLHIYEWGTDRINFACDTANEYISKLPKKEEAK